MTIAEKTLEQLNKLWIPVSVEMPKNEDEVIFCTDGGAVEMGIFTEEHLKGKIDFLDGILDSNGETIECRWLCDEYYYTNDEVVAWIPLIDEYKEDKG